MSAAVDDQILQRFTGQTQVRDPAVARASLDACRDRLTSARGRLRRARWELFYRRARMIPVTLRCEPWLLALIVAAVAALSVSLLSYFVWSLGQGLVLAMMPMIFAAAGGWTLWLLWDRDGETPQSRTQVRRSLSDSARERVRQLAREAQRLAGIAEHAQLLLHGIRQAIAYPLNRLLNAQCDQMNGTEFEIYLEEIFTLLGYAVERLGGSGDQGVDLIVSRGEQRIAVQAKCYSGPLGNKPVQEVFAGARIHSCHRWMVVTNSTFTVGGREAAAKTGTIPIEGAQLPALIRGRLVI